MTDHKAECVLSDPCSADEPRHGYCGNSDFSWCMHCEEACDCARIQRAEQRVLDALDLAGANVKYQRIGFAAGLGAAREAVAALDIGRDVRFSVDVKADALAAIDALRGQR